MSATVDLFLHKDLGKETACGEPRVFYDRPNMKGAAEFDTRFLESIPSVWASAYVFYEKLRAGNPDALETLGALLYLLWDNHLIVESVDDGRGSQLTSGAYDPELLPALHGTYPRGLSLAGADPVIQILRLSQWPDVIVGGYFQPSLVFPARHRARWRQNEFLRDYCTEPSGRDSSKETGLRFLHKLQEEDRQEFGQWFAKAIQSGAGSQQLDRDVISQCRVWAEQASTLGIDRHSWDAAGQSKFTDCTLAGLSSRESAVNADSLREAYPLQIPKSDGGRTYFLLAKEGKAKSNLQLLNPALKTPILFLGGAGLLEFQLKVNGAKRSLVAERRQLSLELEAKDDVKYLSEMLLEKTAVCVMPERKHDQTESLNIHPFHRKASLGADTIALLPLRQELLELFPGRILPSQNLDLVISGPEPAGEGTLCWQLNLNRLFHLSTQLPEELCWMKWETSRFEPADLPKLQVAIWPPKQCGTWKLYAACVLRDRDDETMPRAQFLDFEGIPANPPKELGDNRSIHVMSGSSKNPCPAAIIFVKGQPQAPQEMGAACLQWDSSSDANQYADLAVDLGTSNTAIATMKTGGTFTPALLGTSPIKLAQRRIWGKTPKLPYDFQFFPREFASFEKGFFPTALITLQGLAPGIETLSPEDTFSACIPAFQPKLLGDLFKAKGPETLNEFKRVFRQNMKWKGDGSADSSWRGVFLSQALVIAMAHSFFDNDSRISRFVFSYPLAFSSKEYNLYKAEVETIVKKVYKWCFGKDYSDRVQMVDESSAAAHGKPPIKESICLVLDVGGGTTDMAIMGADAADQNKSICCVRDSLRVAGNQFFSFTEKNLLRMEGQTKGHRDVELALKVLLAGNWEGGIPDEAAIDKEQLVSPEFLDKMGVNYSLYYALQLNKFTEADVRQRERLARGFIRKGAAYQQVRAEGGNAHAKGDQGGRAKGDHPWVRE